MLISGAGLMWTFEELQISGTSLLASRHSHRVCGLAKTHKPHCCLSHHISAKHTRLIMDPDYTRTQSNDHMFLSVHFFVVIHRPLPLSPAWGDLTCWTHKPQGLSKWLCVRTRLCVCPFYLCVNERREVSNLMAYCVCMCGGLFPRINLSWPFLPSSPLLLLSISPTFSSFFISLFFFWCSFPHV